MVPSVKLRVLIRIKTIIKKHMYQAPFTLIVSNYYDYQIVCRHPANTKAVSDILNTEMHD